MLQCDCIRDADAVFGEAEIGEGDLVMGVCGRVIVIVRVRDGRGIRDSTCGSQVGAFALCLGHCVALCVSLKQVLQTWRRPQSTPVISLMHFDRFQF